MVYLWLEHSRKFLGELCTMFLLSLPTPAITFIATELAEGGNYAFVANYFHKTVTNREWTASHHSLPHPHLH